MAASSRHNCWTQHAWRYIAIVLFVIALITATVPFSTGSSYISGSGFFLSLIFSGWFFLGLFWNVFVVSWESCRREVMHPAAVVALDLITWLYSVVAVVFGILSVLSTASIYSNQQTYEKEGYIYRFWQLSYPQYTEGMVCFIIFVICAAALTVIHFAVFVIGCKEEDRRRKGLRAPPAYDASKLERDTGTGSYDAGSRPSFEAVAAAKQAEIEEQERAFGSGNGRTGYGSSAGYTDTVKNW